MLINDTVFNIIQVNKLFIATINLITLKLFTHSHILKLFCFYYYKEGKKVIQTIVHLFYRMQKDKRGTHIHNKVKNSAEYVQIHKQKKCQLSESTKIFHSYN